MSSNCRLNLRNGLKPSGNSNETGTWKHSYFFKNHIRIDNMYSTTENELLPGKKLLYRLKTTTQTEVLLNQFSVYTTDCEAIFTAESKSCLVFRLFLLPQGIMHTTESFMYSTSHARMTICKCRSTCGVSR